MASYDHLFPETQALMTLPALQRMEFALHDRWVGYERANAILQHLDNLITYPRSHRMPNILVVGRSGNGKSALLNRFVGRHPIRGGAEGEAIVPIVDVEVPGTPDESELWTLMLTRLAIQHREKDPAAVKLALLKRILSTVQVKVLVLDEFNNFTRAGKAAGNLLASIKNLSNELRLGIAAFGTQEAVNALNSDPQMKSRFQPLVLDRWTINQSYLRFLVTYEKMLPLAKPSNLIGEALVTDLKAMAGDTLGGTVKLLKAAAREAIASGEECITPGLLGRLEWTSEQAWTQVGRRI